MRPKAILAFELLYLSTLALGLVHSWISWDDAVEFLFPGSFVINFAVSCLVVGGLTLLVSRRRSRVAMWLLILLFVPILPVLYQAFSMGILLGSFWITLIQAVGRSVALGLLFTPKARAWMGKRNDAAMLHQTFS